MGPRVDGDADGAALTEGWLEGRVLGRAEIEGDRLGRLDGLELDDGPIDG